ncbi:MAG: hypothetical protein R2838_22010 [Caldilineaceae bacterium]
MTIRAAPAAAMTGASSSPTMRTGPACCETIRATGAQRIGVTHGYVNQMTRYLNEHGWQAEVVPTRFEGDRLEDESEDDTDDVTQDAPT